MQLWLAFRTRETSPQLPSVDRQLAASSSCIPKCPPMYHSRKLGVESPYPGVQCSCADPFLIWYWCWLIGTIGYPLTPLFHYVHVVISSTHVLDHSTSNGWKVVAVCTSLMLSPPRVFVFVWVQWESLWYWGGMAQWPSQFICACSNWLSKAQKQATEGFQG